MAERFNGSTREVLKQMRFALAAEWEVALENCSKTCKHLIPQRALNHLSPVQALKSAPRPAATRQAL